jgi:hypothetical protein
MSRSCFVVRNQVMSLIFLRKSVLDPVVSQKIIAVQTHLRVKKGYGTPVAKTSDQTFARRRATTIMEGARARSAARLPAYRTC